jgi:hypothetical protein
VLLNVRIGGLAERTKFTMSVGLRQRSLMKRALEGQQGVSKWDLHSELGKRSAAQRWKPKIAPPSPPEPHVPFIRG